MTKASMAEPEMIEAPAGTTRMEVASYNHFEVGGGGGGTRWCSIPNISDAETHHICENHYVIVKWG